LNSTKPKGKYVNTRFYQSPGLNIERIARDLEGCYLSQDYKVQHLGNKDHMVVQLKMGSDFEAVIGMQAALTITLQRYPRGVVATVGQQQWIDKAAAGAVGMLLLWPLMVTAGVGVIRQSGLESQVFSMLDSVVLRQRSDVKIGSVPPDVASEARQQAPPWPAPGQGSGSRGCANCGELYTAGDVYCSRCGKPLAPPKKYCPECKAEVKSNATFCTKCGMQFPT